MKALCTKTSIDSVVIPGSTISPARASTSAATRPAMRIFSIVSGVLIRGSDQGSGVPLSA